MEWMYVLAMLFLIVMSNAVSCGVPAADTADRASITLTLLLTAVAYKFVIASELPNIGYLTYMDIYLAFCFLVLGASIFEILLISPVITSPFPFDTRKLDLWFNAILYSTWITVHIFILIGSRCNWFSTPRGTIMDTEEEDEPASISGSIEFFDEADEDDGDVEMNPLLRADAAEVAI
jgi:hypothetical protein